MLGFCTNENMSKKEIMIRRRFQSHLATSLITANVGPRKRGRPSLDGNENGDNERVDDDVTAQGNRIKRGANPLPTDDMRLDAIGHFPENVAARGRYINCYHSRYFRCCLNPKCISLCIKIQTNTLCSKCNIRLCFTDQRNCFTLFHTNN